MTTSGATPAGWPTWRPSSAPAFDAPGGPRHARRRGTAGALVRLPSGRALLAHAARAELDADPRACGAREFGDGVLPGPLAAAAHDQQIPMAEVIAQRAAARTAAATAAVGRAVASRAGADPVAVGPVGAGPAGAGPAGAARAEQQRARGAERNNG